MLVLAVSLTVVGFGEVRAVGLMLDADISFDGALAAIVAAGWTLVLLLGLYAAAWNVVGKEVIQVDATSLTVRRCLAGWCRARSYALTELSNLRVESEEGGWFGPAWWMFGIKANMLAVDAAGSTVRFGDRLEAHRARELLDELQARIPSAR